MRIQYNSPVVLTYTFICTALLFAQTSMAMNIMPHFAVSGEFSPSPMGFFQLFSHVLGHADWNHLMGNFSFILLLGPMLEEKYGSGSLLLMILFTALITGLLNIFFFSTGLLGASGVVFMMILLSSIVNLQKGKIPLTFILVVALFLGKEIANAFSNNQISEFAHIVGGVCGAIFGFQAQRFRRIAQ
jgi:membrane associated rhomboid family serine protease